MGEGMGGGIRCAGREQGRESQAEEGTIDASSQAGRESQAEEGAVDAHRRRRPLGTAPESVRRSLEGRLGGAGFCSQRPLSSPAHPKVAAAHPGAPKGWGLHWTGPVHDAESPSLVKGPLGSGVWSGPPPWSCPGELPGLQEP